MDSDKSKEIIDKLDKKPGYMALIFVVVMADPIKNIVAEVIKRSGIFG